VARRRRPRARSEGRLRDPARRRGAVRLNILLTGARGQLGRELAASLAALGNVVACDRSALDVADTGAIAATVRRAAPDVIVNAAAYTAVDRAESERDLAFAVNARAPEALATAAKRIGALLVHYSTDYVFDGERDRPYDEDAPTRPQNAYGESKLAGEQAIAASGACALILRTSWVYARHGHNFLTTMQRLAAVRSELRVVADQTGVPNWARALARATTRVLAGGLDAVRERAGLYHLCAAGSATWHEFACAILRDRPGVRIVPIGTADYPTPARRPRYAVLDATRFARTFGFALPDWQILLHESLHSAAEPPTATAVDDAAPAR
jgi:dTDP-4-dehydrorhamnose reductase